jgi:hypothetical protein
VFSSFASYRIRIVSFVLVCSLHTVEDVDGAEHSLITDTINRVYHHFYYYFDLECLHDLVSSERGISRQMMMDESHNQARFMEYEFK